MESIKTTEELLKENKRWRYVRTDKNGTRYFINYTCERCGGRGGWEGWPGFTCYECGGSGVSECGNVVKVYTPIHAAKLAKQRQARAEKAQKLREQKAIAERDEKLAALGFGVEDGTYVIYRVVGETYSIKDELKALGCKFRPVIGWYTSHALEGHETQRMEESQVLTDSVFIEWKTKAEIEPLLLENTRAQEASPSQHIGKIGERLELELHIDRKFESSFYVHEGPWGCRDSYMYLMHDAAGNIFKWSSGCSYEEGEDVHFKATVKDHVEYKGIPQTVLTRCTKVKEK